MRSTPSSMADRKDASVFSGNSSALPRCPPSRMRPLPSLTVRVSAMRSCYPFRKPSRMLYIRGQTQEIHRIAP